MSRSVTLRRLATLTQKPIVLPMVKPMEERVEVRGAKLELRLWPLPHLLPRDPRVEPKEKKAPTCPSL